MLFVQLAYSMFRVSGRQLCGWLFCGCVVQHLTLAQQQLPPLFTTVHASTQLDLLSDVILISLRVLGGFMILLSCAASTRPAGEMEPRIFLNHPMLAGWLEGLVYPHVCRGPKCA